MHLLRVALGVAMLASQAVPPQAPTPATEPAVEFAYVPERVFHTGRNAFSDFEALIADVARADVVFVGEQHDDPNTHRLEEALLQGFRRREIIATVSLEMFERDVQRLLDEYLARSIPEEEFLKESRPWPRYASDYRPLVEFAREHGWRVLAANVPRKHASAVAKDGLAVLDDLTPAERSLIARDIECPFDGYFDRFVESMGSHPMPGADNLSAEDRRAMHERFYFAQCIKDETMAASIVRVLQQPDRTPGPIVHYTGAFHSDFFAGAAERVRRRAPAARFGFI